MLTWLAVFLELRPLGEVIMLSFEMRVREGAALLPDIMVVLNEHKSRLTDQRLEGAADIVIAIVEPPSSESDRGMRFVEFANAGVQEYWIIDPYDPARAVELYQLTGERTYESHIPDADGKVWSKVLPDIWIDPAWITGDDFPSGLELAFEMAGVTKSDLGMADAARSKEHVE